MPALLDIIFPKICVSCKREGTHLCQDCFALISLNNVPEPHAPGSSLSGLFFATSFEHQLVKDLIHYFKYPPFIKELAQPLAALIIAHFAMLDKPQRLVLSPDSSKRDGNYRIIPLPLHRKRLKWRGFNQAEEIGRELSRTLDFPLYIDVLVRVKNTKPQVELRGAARTENVSGAFAVQYPEKIRKKKILLLDDVFTTGATMEEAARVLKEAGAKQVFGVVAARG